MDHVSEPRATRVGAIRRKTVDVLGAGLALSAGAAIGRLLESQLYGVWSGEPWLLTLTTLGFTACGLLAIWMPPRRAAAMNPAAALKQEL